MKKKPTVNAGIRKQDTTDSKVMFPSMEPPQVPEFYSATYFAHLMPDVVDLQNPIQGIA